MRFPAFIILLLLATSGSAAVRSRLYGRVTDSTGASLFGAVIELPDLHTGAVADTGGNFEIPNLPSGRFLVTVRLLGFATQSNTINLNGDTRLDFRLVEAVLEQHEVIVTGTSAASEQRRSTTPIQTITARQMAENASTNVVDAITRIPGVQQISTGPAISKPVIRGLSYNRIITLSDGIRQEGQQWGDEHGIEIDDYNVSRVEVLKGPASLTYGPDAIAGVINILSEEPAPRNKILANIVGNYQTNNGLYAGHARIAGHNNDWIWSGYYTGKAAHDYRNTYDAGVFNTRFTNSDLGGSLGVSKHWGSSRLSASFFDQWLGVAEGNRDSTTGRFLKDVAQNGVVSSEPVTESDNKSYQPDIPRQHIRHLKVALVNTVYLKDGARAGVTLGIQENRRQEFGDVLNPDDPGLDLRLRTATYDLHYLFAEKGGWQFSTGISGMEQRNDNLGIEFLVPDYNVSDIGGYVIAKREWKSWTLSAGLRYDHRLMSAYALYVDSQGRQVREQTPGSFARFMPFSKSFASPSGSFGLSYAYSRHTIFKLNFASGYRAPNIAELSANGVHEGAIRYEYGNTDLTPENSFQGDLGLDYNSEHLSMSAAVFYNYIHDYIYIRKLSAANGTDSIPVANNPDAFPAFIYAQTNAGLIGGEFFLDLHPHPFDWLHFENTLSYVQGENLNGSDSTRYLPNIPGARWLTALRVQKKSLGRHLGNAYFKLELDHNFEQNKVFAAYGTETASSSYSLLNASLGFDILNKSKRTLATLTLSGQNLGDVAYQNHLSRLQYADLNYTTGRRGIFGMGRNISMTVAVPLTLR